MNPAFSHSMADPDALLAAAGDVFAAFVYAVVTQNDPLATLALERGAPLRLPKKSWLQLASFVASSGSKPAFTAVVARLSKLLPAETVQRFVRATIAISAEAGDLPIVEACLAASSAEARAENAMAALAGGAARGRKDIVAWCLLQCPPDRPAAFAAMERAWRNGHTEVLDALLPFHEEFPSRILERTPDGPYFRASAGCLDKMVLWCFDNGGAFLGPAVWRTCTGHRGAVFFRLTVLSRLPPEARAAEVEKWRASLSGPPRTAFVFAD